MNFQTGFHRDNVLFYIIIITLCILRPSIADVFEECNGVAQGNFVKSPKGCRYYIYCENNDSYEGECADEDDYFNPIYSTCDPKDTVDCIDNNPTTLAVPPTLSTDGALAWITARPPQQFPNTPVIPTANTAPTTVNPQNIPTTLPSTATNNANNVTIGTSNVPNFSTTITDETSTNPTNKPITSHPVSSVVIANLNCPAVRNPNQIIFLIHPKSCSEYFICYNGAKIPMRCSALLHFNTRTGQCDFPQNAKCQTNYSYIPPREQCQPHTIDVYPHGYNCNYYYYCKNGFLLLQQCPFFYGWDYERRQCVAIRNAKCYNNRAQL